MTKSIDDILNDGAPGLQYFEQLGPRYVAAFGGSFNFYELVRPYDNEREMSVAKLDAAASALRQLLTTADSKITAQQSAAQSMQTGWQGAAAEAAAGQLGRIATMAGEDCDAVRNFEAALTNAAAEIPGLVKAKADTVLKLTDGAVELYVGGKPKTMPTVGGLDPTAIDRVIRGAETGQILNEELAIMTGHRNSAGAEDVPNTAAEIKNTTSPEYKDAIKAICKRWLSVVFMPDYNGKAQIFKDQCTTTRIAIENLFRTAEQAAAGVVERSYPSVAGSGTAPGEQQPQGDKSQAQGDQSQGGKTQSQGDQSGGGNNQASTGNPTTTAGTQTDDTSAAKTTTQNNDDSSTDDSTDDSDISSALSSLSSTISELGTTLSSALTGDLGDTLTSTIESVGTSISDGIEQMTEQASSLLSGEHEASFQIGDTKVSIEAGENGLSLTTTDADGDTNQYRLTLDENGNPVITQDSTDASAIPDGSADAPSGDNAENADAEQGDAAPPVAQTPAAPPAPTEDPASANPGNGENPGTGGTSGIPRGGTARPEPDGEHTPTIPGHPVSNPGDSGAELAEAGPL